MPILNFVTIRGKKLNLIIIFSIVDYNAFDIKYK